MWRCDACNAAFCRDCVSSREMGGRGSVVVYVCPGCGCAVEELPEQGVVEPFWNRLPRFLAYPFTATAAGFILVLSVLMALFSSPGVLSAVIELLLFGALLKYCFDVLKQTTRGSMAPPGIDERIIAEDLAPWAQYWLLYLLVAAALWAVLSAIPGEAAAAVGRPALAGAYTACLVILPLVMPVAAMNLSMGASFPKALNPPAMMRTASKIGRPYLAMYLSIVVLFLVPCAFVYLIRPYVPAVLYALFSALACCCCFIIAHHLIGYVMLQYRGVLGYETDLEGPAVGPNGISSGGEAASDILASAEVLIREGKHQDALELIRAETGAHFTDPGLSGRYYHLLRLLNRHDEMIGHARSYLELLVRAGSMDTARNVYLECAAIEPSFNPRSPILFKVAASLSEVGNYRASLEAYDRFIRVSPDVPMVPKAYFLTARILSEKMLEPQKAADILEKLIRDYPDHEITPHARRYLRGIENQG